MEKVYYTTETERENVLSLAQKDGWVLTEDGITIHGKYLVFDTKTLEKVKMLQGENADLWYETMVSNAKFLEQDREMAELWYELMLGGVS